MDRIEATCLAQAVDLWLRYKKVAGFEDMLGESLLTIAVAECLNAKGWLLRAEQDLCTISPGIGADPGYCNFDLLATKNKNADHPTRCILELKYLKLSRNGKSQVAVGSADRVTDDIFKLAYPVDARLKRLFILARERNVLLQEKLRQIFSDTSDNVRVRIDCSSNELPGEGISSFKPSNGIKGSIPHLGKQAAPQACFLTCLYDGSIVATSDMNVSVYEVSRID